MKIVRNYLWVLKTVFSIAPLHLAAVLVCEISVALFRPFQIIVTQRLVDYGNSYVNSGEGLNGLILWGGMLVAVLILWVTLQKLENYIVRVRIKKRIVQRFTPKIMDKLERLPYRFFEDKESNDLLEKIADNPEKLLENSLYIPMIALFALISIGATLALMLAYSLWIGIGMMILAVPMTLLVNYMGRLDSDLWVNASPVRRREAYLRELVSDKHAVYETNVFGSGGYVEDKWYEAQDELYKMTRKIMVKQSGARIVYQLLNIAYMLYVGGLSVLSFSSGAFTIGQLAAMLDSMYTIIVKLNRSCRFFSRSVYLLNAVEHVRGFFSLPQEPVSSEKTDGNYDIVFSHVYFTYPGTDREILRDINIRIRRGERVAFVGENGSGKSTVIKLLCGLYQPTEGHIFVGGHDICTLSDEERHRFISVLFQDYRAYNMTLRENTAIGDVSKLNNDEAVIQAIKDAGGESIIEQYPKGIDTMLGKLTDEGVDLSGGQWQRVAMSRAFVSDAVFVVLDEPTAALDPVAESNMYESFAQIFEGRGAIMISHRLASAKMADRIFVLDGGRIVECGSHSELMENGGLYADMFNVQASWYRDREGEKNAQDIY